MRFRHYFGLALRSDEIVYSTDNTLAVAPVVAAWLTERVPEAAAAGGADALARAVATFCFNAFGVDRDGTEIPALYERNAKVAHACLWAANTTFFRPGHGTRGGMLTLAPITPGTPLLYDYIGGGMTLYTTAVRRHLLRRGKMFDCFCEACSAPDALAALPCPACVPRDPVTGLVPQARLVGGARELFSHPLVVPDGVHVGASTPPAWRCDTCGGVFSAERMAALQIAAGVCRPSPRVSSLKLAAKPAALLDVARWADAAVAQMLLELPRSPYSATPEAEAEFLFNYMYRLVPIVGTAHASVLRLRFEHLKVLHRVTIDMQGGMRATTASAAKRLTGRVALLDAQLPALEQPAGAGGVESIQPLMLATAITAGVANMWPRLRAAGMLRATSTNMLPANYITLTIQLVQCLGAEREAMLAKPLRAMLRELPPMSSLSDTMRLVIMSCNYMLGE